MDSRTLQRRGRINRSLPFLLGLLALLIAAQPIHATCEDSPECSPTPEITLDSGTISLPIDPFTPPDLPAEGEPSAAPEGAPATEAAAPQPPAAAQPAASTGLIWPLRGLITTRPRAGHMGLDIDGRTGDPIVASASGTVSFAGWNRTGYGYMIILGHGQGRETAYAHLSSFAVQHGQQVTQGQVIGFVGSTGRSTGSHLHFEVREWGVRKNPLNYLP